MAFSSMELKGELYGDVLYVANTLYAMICALNLVGGGERQLMVSMEPMYFSACSLIASSKVPADKVMIVTLGRVEVRKPSSDVGRGDQIFILSKGCAPRSEYPIVYQFIAYQISETYPFNLM